MLSVVSRLLTERCGVASVGQLRVFSDNGSWWHLRVLTLVVDTRHVMTSTLVEGIYICQGAHVWRVCLADAGAQCYPALGLQRCAE